MSALSRATMLSMLCSDFSHWIDLPAAGAGGGILVAWRQGLGLATAS